MSHLARESHATPHPACHAVLHCAALCLPSPAMPAMLSLASPSHTSERITQPCRAQPAVPCLTVPCQTMLHRVCRALHHLAIPGPAAPSLACHAEPTSLRWTSPHLASPAEPSLTSPGLAVPHLTTPSRACRAGARQTVLCLAWPAVHCHGPPSFASPGRACRALAHLAAPRPALPRLAMSELLFTIPYARTGPTRARSTSRADLRKFRFPTPPDRSARGAAPR